MIYIISFILLIAIIYLIVVIRENKMHKAEIQLLKDRITSLDEKGRILKHNYESLKKVYMSLLKKHNTTDKEYKKLQKQVGRL